jgi:hypothetical protein
MAWGRTSTPSLMASKCHHFTVYDGVSVSSVDTLGPKLVIVLLEI